MAFIVNNYELLSIPINATEDEVRAAYEQKMVRANKEMSEKYKTAYYILTDPYRRQKYDLQLGIHKYRNVPRIYRVGKACARVILTILDAVCSFYWCLLVVIVLGVVGYKFYLYKNQGIIFEPFSFVTMHQDEIIILGGFALMDLIGHFYIRRANRFLKHYDWEYIVKKEDI